MIAFTAPWALLGLAAAALPLLLHLVQRREPPERAFPAIRYLEDATRDPRRRLRFRNWLLLILRTLLIIALVLAAAGATMRRVRVGPHAPSALVIVLDNSASSGAIVDGEPLLARLVRSARQVLDHATLSDRLWILAADGIARPGSADELRARLGELTLEPIRLDLGAAIGQARDLVVASGRPGEVVVISDMQQTALGAARGAGPVLVLRPTAVPPANRAITGLSAGVQPWGPEGGHVTVTVTSSDTTPVPVTLTVGGRPLRDVLVSPGIASVQRIGVVAPGWTMLTASLPPDELRSDDAQVIGLRVAPPAAVHWDAAEKHVNAALSVLAADGRVRAGGGMQFGSLGPGVSVVEPPADPARVGALNRLLAARGATWRFGNTIIAAGRSDSGALIPSRENVTRRVALESIGSSGDVLATVDRSPWIVRTGDVILLGSRLDPDWTTLPLSAAFVPFVDAVVTRASRGDLAVPDAAAGVPVAMPPRVTAVVQGGHSSAIGNAPWRPSATGVYHLLAAGDTVGAVSVHIDPRESILFRAPDRAIRSLWPGATIAGLDDGPSRAFAAGTRGDLRGALLLVALACVLGETTLVGRARRKN